MSDRFTCENCGGTYRKAWSDAEAHAEADEVGFPPQDRVLVCNPCYVRIMNKARMMGLVPGG